MHCHEHGQGKPLWLIHMTVRDVPMSCAQSPSQFLQQHAAKRAAHRRDRAATQLQRFWRKAVSGGATSRQLAAAFAATGLPEGPAVFTGAARQQRPIQVCHHRLA